MPMTTKEYQNKLALKMIRSFVNDLYNKTGMKATIKIDRLHVPKSDDGSRIKEIMSLDILEERFLEAIPYNFTGNPFHSKSRKGEYVDLRCIFSHIACKHLGFPLIAVGRYLKKDHTSIIHMCKRGDNLLENDEKFTALYDTIFTKINTHVEFPESDNNTYKSERILPTSVYQ